MGAFGQFLAAEFRLGRHAPFELRVGFKPSEQGHAARDHVVVPKL
jgi:hypothetical protein